MSDNFGTNGEFFATRAIMAGFAFGLFIPGCIMGFIVGHGHFFTRWGFVFFLLLIPPYLFRNYVIKKAKEGDGNTLGWNLISIFIFIIGLILGFNAH